LSDIGQHGSTRQYLQRNIDQIDMLAAYRTAPHEDVIATRHKALSMLIRCIGEERRPHVAWVGIPVALPGERTSTAVEPAKSLYASLAESDKVSGILDASLFVGYVWADEARNGAAAVVTGFNAASAEEQARVIARKYWDARERFDLAVEAGSIDECIERGVAAEESTVFISDSGDNPTAGAVGDSPLFLARLLALDVNDAVVASIADAESLAACRAAGVGKRVSLALGGKLDPAVRAAT
jgi:microcystin degradation protein MlrC